MTIYGAYLTFLSALLAPALALAVDLSPQLLGKVSYHDGPNCYNAVAAAKGFTEGLYQSSSMELRYYLDQNCQIVTDTPRKGDILTVLWEGRLDHAAVFAGKKQIFEKESTSGLYGAYRNSVESADYRKIKIYNSRYVQSCRHSSQHCRLEVLRCDQAQVKDPKNLPTAQECLATAEFSVIKKWRKKFESIAFTNSEMIPVDMAQLVQNLLEDSALIEQHQLNSCSLYYLSSWNSLAWNIDSLRREYRQNAGKNFDASLVPELPLINLLDNHLKNLYLLVEEFYKASADQVLREGL